MDNATLAGWNVSDHEGEIGIVAATTRPSKMRDQLVKRQPLNKFSL